MNVKYKMLKHYIKICQMYIFLNIYLKNNYSQCYVIIMNLQKIKDLEFGLKNENPVKNILEKVFNISLIHSKYKFSLFDYFDIENKYLFEIKNYRYSINTYTYEIIGVNKGISNNCIFVFQHEENDIFYIQFNKEIFKTFKQRNIYYRGVGVLCYDIPKQNLTKLDINNKYILNYDINECKIIKKNIEIDNNKYLNSIKINDLFK